MSSLNACNAASVRICESSSLLNSMPTLVTKSCRSLVQSIGAFEHGCHVDSASSPFVSKLSGSEGKFKQR